LNERLRIIRKKFKLSQAEFGKRLGVQNTAISKLENGERNLTDQMILSICREYGIKESWLRNGEGDMFIANEDDFINQLTEMGFDTLSTDFVKAYLSLPPLHRKTLNDSIILFNDVLNSKPGKSPDGKIVVTQDEIDMLNEFATSDGEAFYEQYNIGMTKEEFIAAAAKRWEDAKKGLALSTTSANYGTG